MAQIGTTPTTVDWNITKATDMTISFKVTTKSSGLPFDISEYEFYFVVRDEKNTLSTKRIEILNADIIQSDSGLGTIDTFTIDVTNSLSDMEQKIYYHEIRSKKISGGDNDVWFHGAFNVEWTVQNTRI